jgi:hypothetical protein
MSSLLWLRSIGRPSQEDSQGREQCFWRDTTNMAAPGQCKVAGKVCPSCTRQPGLAQPHRPSLPQASLRPEGSNRKAGAHLKRQETRRTAVVAVTNGRLDDSTERSAEGFGRAQPRASRRGPHAEGSPKSLAPGSGSSKARRNGWPVSLDGRRRKRVLVKVIGE